MAKNTNPNPKYLNLEQEINKYVEEEEDFKDAMVFRDLVKEEVIKEKKLVSKVATRGLEEEPIEPLERETPRIVGSLFDRLEFLKQRIDESNSAMENRKTMHNDMVAEILADIKEKQDIESRLVDIDDKRNFRMDISLLRKEMRAETVRFWKDLLELRTELRELLEQYQTESKIVGIFKDIEMAAISKPETAARKQGEKA
jgi:hypothetical protein